MAEDAEQQAVDDVTATTDSYGGPVSDEELADVYLPEGQQAVDDPGAADSAAAGDPPSADRPEADSGEQDRRVQPPDGTGTIPAASDAPAVEPPD